MSDIVATYLIETEYPEEALTAITRGQSVGNPTIKTPYETQQFLSKWKAHGNYDIRESREGLHTMTVTFPQANFGDEGINYLLSVVMGGQCDVDIIKGCRLIDLELGAQPRHWSKPRYGVEGLRKKLGVYGRPFLCGIIKPKIGLTPQQLSDVVKQMVDGGCDVIKEDEILADQFWCPMKDRLPLVATALQGSQTLYLCCITADGSEAWRKARQVEDHGEHFAVHCNLWAGLGTYLDIRRHVSCPIFFQKSGDKVWSTGNYSIDYSVLCQLIYYAGCDMAHVGMYGGYLSEPMDVLKRRIRKLQTTLPSFSCGMNPTTAEQITYRFGKEVMITSGGWIHGQLEGITAACKTMRRAIDASSQALKI